MLMLWIVFELWNSNQCGGKKEKRKNNSVEMTFNDQVTYSCINSCHVSMSTGLKIMQLVIVLQTIKSGVLRRHLIQ